jgi:hypothetical protein
MKKSKTLLWILRFPVSPILRFFLFLVPQFSGSLCSKLPAILQDHAAPKPNDPLRLLG